MQKTYTSDLIQYQTQNHSSYFFLQYRNKMGNESPRVTLGLGVGLFSNQEDQIPEQLKLLQLASEVYIRILDTSRIYVCHTSNSMICSH
jgi:hypothetical protein